MDTILQADIFFFITSAAVILVTLLVIVGLYYVVIILRNVRDISETAKRGSEILAEDFSSLRGTVKKRGLTIRRAVDFFLQLITPRRRKKSSGNKKGEQ